MNGAHPVGLPRAAPFLALLRHLAGFAFAPAVAPVLLLAFEVYRTATTVPRGWSPGAAEAFSPLRLVWEFATAWMPAAYVFAIVLGVPIVLGLRAARRLTVPWVVGLSAALAAAVAVVGFLVASAVADGQVDPEALPVAGIVAGVGGVLAAAVAGAYCAVAGVPLGAPPAAPQGSAAVSRG